LTSPLPLLSNTPHFSIQRFSMDLSQQLSLLLDLRPLPFLLSPSQLNLLSPFLLLPLPFLLSPSQLNLLSPFLLLPLPFLLPSPVCLSSPLNFFFYLS
jgi:hypothetical protein